MTDIWCLASQQQALMTRTQVQSHLTDREFRRLARTGEVTQARPGVWRVTGAPVTYPQTVLAGVLAAGGDAWASHRTAARLHGLRVVAPDGIDVLTLPNRRVRLEGVVHHRNVLIPIDDVTRAHGVPVTNVARTLVDCIPWLPGRMLGIAVDDALRRGILDLRDLEAAHAALDEGRRTGRHKVVPMREVLALRLDGQLPGGSDRELDVLQVLREAGLPLPVQQHAVTVAGRPRVLDYAYPRERIYLEFDGFAEHGLIRSTFDDDRERDGELVLLGWLGLHFTSRTTARDLVSRVDRALHLRAA